MNKFLAGTVLGFASAAAMANPLQELMENTYGGLSLAVTRYPAFCDGATTCNQNAGWKFYGGFRMSPAISGEIGYLNFERIQAQTQVTTSIGNGSNSRSLRTAGFVFNLAFTQELSDNWSAVGRIGIARMKNVGTVIAPNGAQTDPNSEVHTEPYFGAALELNMSDLIGKIFPAPIDRFKMQLGADISRAQFNGYKRYLTMYSIGGGFEF